MTILRDAPNLLTERDLKLLQALIHEECSMDFDERRVCFLQDRLHRRLRLTKLDFAHYYQLLTSREGKAELTVLIEDLAVYETSFFRNRPQLELFRKTILEEILARKQAARDFVLHLWSAGCSTGQEPYTVAMLVADALAYYYVRSPVAHPLPSLRPLISPPWNVEILASDINYSVLRVAQEGVYPEHSMEPVEYAYRLRYFDKMTRSYAVKKALKDLIRFDFHNLKTEFLPQQNDVIFCRNVMMLFEVTEQKRLIEKFYRSLKPNGYLFLGQAESLFGLTDRFRMVHQNNGTCYQRIET